MIKDVMVRLDGGPADNIRLDTAKSLAKTFDGEIIGLFLNPLPLPVSPDLAGAATIQDQLFHLATTAGDAIEADLTARLARLDSPAELRRFDVPLNEMVEVASGRNPWADYEAIRAEGPFPFGEGAFDVSFAVCVLHHVPPPQRLALVSEMARVTRPGGTVAIFEHNPWNPLTRRAVAGGPYSTAA